MQLYPYRTPDGIIDLVRKTEYDALFQSLCEAEELIREIRDNEVNAQDEATKFLRDHQSSELSKLRADNAKLEAEIAASNASSENELLQMVQSDNIQLLQQNERLIDARNKLREELKTTQKLLADANRGAERNAKANWELAGHVNEARAELAKWQALAGQLAEAISEAPYDEPLAEAFAAYESAKTGNLPDPLAEAVKRMEAVSLNSLIETYREEIDDALHSFEDRDEALSSDKVVEIAMEAVRARLIQAAKGERP